MQLGQIVNNKIQRGQTHNPGHFSGAREQDTGHDPCTQLHRGRGAADHLLPLLWPNPPGSLYLTPFKGATCSPHKASNEPLLLFSSLSLSEFSSGLLSLSTNWRVQEPGSVTEERIDKSDYIKIDINSFTREKIIKSPWRRCEDQQINWGGRLPHV